METKKRHLFPSNNCSCYQPEMIKNERLGTAFLVCYIVVAMITMFCILHTKLDAIVSIRVVLHFLGQGLFFTIGVPIILSLFVPLIHVTKVEDWSLINVTEPTYPVVAFLDLSAISSDELSCFIARQCPPTVRVLDLAYRIGLAPLILDRLYGSNISCQFTRRKACAKKPQIILRDVSHAERAGRTMSIDIGALFSNDINGYVELDYSGLQEVFSLFEDRVSFDEMVFHINSIVGNTESQTQENT